MLGDYRVAVSASLRSLDWTKGVSFNRLGVASVAHDVIPGGDHE